MKDKNKYFFLQNKPAKRNLVRKLFTQEKKITIINSRTFLLRKTRIHILLTLNALEANAARSASVRSNSSKLLFSFSINKYFHCFFFCPFGQSVYILARTLKRSQKYMMIKRTITLSFRFFFNLPWLSQIVSCF